MVKIQVNLREFIHLNYRERCEDKIDHRRLNIQGLSRCEMKAWKIQGEALTAQLFKLCTWSLRTTLSWFDSALLMVDEIQKLFLKSRKYILDEKKMWLTCLGKESVGWVVERSDCVLVSFCLRWKKTPWHIRMRHLSYKNEPRYHKVQQNARLTVVPREILT